MCRPLKRVSSHRTDCNLRLESKSSESWHSPKNRCIERGNISELNVIIFYGPYCEKFLIWLRRAWFMLHIVIAGKGVVRISVVCASKAIITGVVSQRV